MSKPLKVIHHRSSKPLAIPKRRPGPRRGLNDLSTSSQCRRHVSISACVCVFEVDVAPIGVVVSSSPGPSSHLPSQSSSSSSSSVLPTTSHSSSAMSLVRPAEAIPYTPIPPVVLILAPLPPATNGSAPLSTARPNSQSSTACPRPRPAPAGLSSSPPLSLCVHWRVSATLHITPRPVREREAASSAGQKPEKQHIQFFYAPL